jgi:hypothetical protein
LWNKLLLESGLDLKTSGIMDTIKYLGDLCFWHELLVTCKSNGERGGICTGLRKTIIYADLYSPAFKVRGSVVGWDEVRNDRDY